jgi:hypothetical protein
MSTHTEPTISADFLTILERLHQRLSKLEHAMSKNCSLGTHTHTTPDLQTGSDLFIKYRLSKLAHAMSKNCSLGTHTHTTPDPQTGSDLFIQYDENTGPRGNSTVFIVQLEMNEVERYHTCTFSFALFMPGLKRQKTDRAWTTNDAEVFVKDHFSSIIAFAVQHTTDEEKRKVLHQFKGFDDCIVDISCQFPVYGDESVTRVGIALGTL